jgi:hypothetical protein
MGQERMNARLVEALQQVAAASAQFHPATAVASAEGRELLQVVVGVGVVVDTAPERQLPILPVVLHLLVECI